MHEAGAAVQRQPAAHHVDGSQFSLGVARWNVDDKARYLAINDPVQRLLYDLVVWRDYNPAAGALLEEVAGEVHPVFFALYAPCSGLVVSSRHPLAFPGAPAGIPRGRAV